jgi:plastocyanin
MKAIGAGATLSAFGGTTVVGATSAADNVAATQEQDDDTDDGSDNSAGSVHVVQTLVGPPTNPERPADFFYEPTGFHAQPGDVVKVVFAAPDHNVLSYHPAFGMRRRVPTGVDPISAPVSGWRPSSIPGDQIEPPTLMIGEDGGDNSQDSDDGGDGGDGSGDDGGGSGANEPVPDTFLFALETPGVYDFVCSPHEAFGMAMRVVVGDVTEARFETSNPENLPEPRNGPFGLARVTLTDPALQPENIVEQGTVRWEDLEATQGGRGAGGDGGGDGNGGAGGGDGDGGTGGDDGAGGDGGDDGAGDDGGDDGTGGDGGGGGGGNNNDD